jgi:hypothetical protein
MWSLRADADLIEVSGRDFTATKKYRDVAATGRAAIVIDDLASTDPWRPRGIEIRGHAQTVTGPEPGIVIHPDRVISWGLDDTTPAPEASVFPPTRKSQFHRRRLATTQQPASRSRTAAQRAVGTPSYEGKPRCMRQFADQRIAPNVPSLSRIGGSTVTPTSPRHGRREAAAQIPPEKERSSLASRSQDLPVAYLRMGSHVQECLFSDPLRVVSSCTARE